MPIIFIVKILNMTRNWRLKDLKHNPILYFFTIFVVLKYSRLSPHVF